MSKGLYPIRTISSLTGVNPVTLRAWERRYGLIRPQRTPKGHRLYTERDIDRIKQILVLLDRGIPISQARQVLDQGSSQAQESGAETSEGDGDVWAEFLSRMRTAVNVYDPHALDDAHQEALSLFHPSRVQQNLLAPLHRQFLDEQDTRTRAAAAFLRGWLRDTLGARFRHRSRHASGPLLLLAPQAPVTDDVPLMLLALEAMERGYRCLLLGPGIGTAELEAAIADAGPDIVIAWTNEPGDFSMDCSAPLFIACKDDTGPGDLDQARALRGSPSEMLNAIDSHYQVAATS